MGRLRIDVLTLFPGMFEPVLGESILKRAREKNIVRIAVHDLRRWAKGKRRTADDRPYGGGPGMVMKPEPLFAAVAAVKKKARIGRGHRRRVVLLSPQGRTLTQPLARALSGSSHLILICGHYEGIDERVRTHLVTDEISIGDYVLTCGELPAMVLIDAVVRLVPGVLGKNESLHSETFEDNLLEYPQYTRPAVYRGMRVPAVLLSGNHEEIARWRKTQALKRTRTLRPDLLKRKDAGV